MAAGWRRRLAGVALVAGVAGSALLYGVAGAPPTPAGPVVLAPREAALSTPSAPPSGLAPIHIILAGTSLTAGGGDWPERLQAALSACTPRAVRIERLAQPGAGIRWGLPHLRARLADPALPQADIVVAEFSINDAALRQGLPLFMARRRTLDLIHEVRAAGAVPYLATMSPGWGRRALIRPGQARYGASYRDIAQVTGAGLIDTLPLWLGLSPAERQRLVPDGLHPVPEALQAITLPTFEVALRPLICGS